MFLSALLPLSFLLAPTPLFLAIGYAGNGFASGGVDLGLLQVIVRAAPPGGAPRYTALVNAVYAALMLPDQGYSRRVLIAFTDGVDTSSWLTAPRVLETARRSDVVAYAVSTGRVAGGSFARDLSEATGGTAIEIGSPADLRTTFLSILAEFRQRYLLSYSPANVPNPGWHPLTVRVKGRRVDVKARTGYLK
jgi:VWFA-related protein